MWALLRLTRNLRVRGRLRLANALNPLVIPSSGYVVSTLENDVTMELDLTDDLQRWIHYLGTYEEREIAFVLANLPRDGVFLDIGANVGWYTLVAARHLQGGGLVYAFEPLAVNVERIRRNLALNRLGNVVLETLALTDREGEIGMASDHPRSGNALMVSVGAPKQRFQVPAIRFDDYSKSLGDRKIDLVKMDIEGAETLALRGMTDLLRGPAAPPILCEINPSNLTRLGSSPEELLGLFASFGYKPFSLGPHSELVKIGEIPGEGLHENYVFVKG
jgi:FkbM family methyltransferase